MRAEQYSWQCAGMWGVEGGVKGKKKNQRCISVLSRCDLFWNSVFTQKKNFVFESNLASSVTITVTASGQITAAKMACFISPGCSGRSRPGQVDQSTHCLAAKLTRHILHFTFWEAPCSSKQLPDQPRTKLLLCWEWWALAMKDRAPLALFPSLLSAYYGESRLEQPFWGPAMNLHHKDSRGQPSWTLSVSAVENSFKKIWPPPASPLLSLCVFVHLTSNGN